MFFLLPQITALTTTSNITSLMKINHIDSLEPVGGFANLGKISGHDKIRGLESEPTAFLFCYMNHHV